MSAIEQYLAPTSLAQALDCLQAGAEVTILAGGTDLMPQSCSGRVKIRRTLMNIRRIPGLEAIALDGDAIRIGALATITGIMGNALVGRHLPMLVEACDHFASDQVRNAGTLGGNISNASPAGDTLVPLLVHDAEVELACRAGGETVTRRLPLSGYITGPGRTLRADNELLTGVRIPLPPAGHRARFFKFGTRPALDISTIAIGIGGVLADGVFSQARVAFGAVAPTPMRGARTEQALEGRRLDAPTIAHAAEVARDEVSPIDDVRASAWYRREMIHNMTQRMLEDAARA